VVGSCERNNKHLGHIKCCMFFSLTEERLASEGGLFSMEIVSCSAQNGGQIV
jgi:hypothetical protein